RVKGVRPGDDLAPPDRLLAGFRWQSWDLGAEAVTAKRLALAAHRTQYGYSASRLLPFVRPNELYGDLTIPILTAGGSAVRLLSTTVNTPAETEKASDAVDLQGLTVRRVRDRLEIEMELQQPLTEGATVSLSALGYRPDIPFAAMPKLEVRIEPHAWTVRDQGRLLPRTAAWGGAQDRKLVARIPLASLNDPRRLFLQVRTGSRRSELGQTPWWIVELRPGTEQRAAAAATGAAF
ncbi:MAG TPA: hypothetical protein VIJ26_03980, partial [Thermoanaerobaculia bacterium]